MNVIIGRIYKAPWGRYVGHREGVLRSLDNSGAFSVQPHADDFIDTGEDLVERTGTRTAELARHDGMEAPDGRGRDERVAPLGDPREPGAQGARGAQEDLLVHERPEESGVQPQAPVVPLQGALSVSPHGEGDEGSPALSLDDPRTLGGMRPGSIYCVVPKMPQLQWKPCLVRAKDGPGPHVYFLASTDHLSLFCPACRARRPLSFVGHKTIVAHINGLVAAGKVAEARGIAEGTRAPSVDNIDELEEIAQAPPVVELKITDHCCPRIVLGHGLHSPACKNFVANAEPVMPAIPRDDPKAEAGSFERVVPWRPKYRDRADWDEWRHERAAIIEYEGGVSRKYAEIAANRLAGPPP